MALQTSLPLSLIVTVNVSLSAVAQSAPTLNQGLIVGPSTIIPSVGGSNPRLRFYTTLAQAASDGFSVANPEYVALGMHLSQSPTPIGAWIGRQDLTAVGTIAVGSNAGTGYKVGDVETLATSGATVAVTSIGTGGSVTGLSLIQGGTGAAVATGIATTTAGSGTGLTVNVTALGESFLTAVTACRLASTAWYGFMCCAAVKADHVALSAYADASAGSIFYIYSTSDPDAGAGAATSIFALNQALAYKNDLGIYSTTQGGLYPNNAYAAAAVMGVAMGHNTGLAGSYFNLKFQPVVGVAPEPFNQISQVSNINSVNGNVMVYVGPYIVLQGGGVLPSGGFFDETLYLNSMAFDFQYAVMNTFVAQSIPLNNIGQQLIISAIRQVCEKYRGIGFISAGVWNGVAILSLTVGQSLPKGYFVQSDNYLNQTPAARAARQGMPVYVALVESGSMDSLTIGVQVQR